ncbi:MAG: DapH/DapD/GlmU-related protein [Verrucomicrobia bacterium]|nr:DapH/DapD/GlmU-related protein [Verrucomicrobiota bacterium]
MKTFNKAGAYDSPWSLKGRLGMLLWDCCWAVFCGWTPKPLNRWRLFWLKCFGGKIHGLPFVHQRARIQIPWNLTLHDRACLGDRANAYTLGEIEIGARSVIAQEAYLCTGTHDLNDPKLPLQVAKITIGNDVFIGARAFLMPGIRVGDRAVVGACSLVTKDVAQESIVGGNPAKVLRTRSKQKAS